MAAVIPAAVATTDFHDPLTHADLTRVHQGKVRDTYSLPDPNLLLVIATDRLSIFDFVLPCFVPHKGELLTALTVFWLTEVLSDIDHHLVAYGHAIDTYLPRLLQESKALHKRALVVRKLKMLPVECIVRGYLTGSGWRSYQETCNVCGITLSKGLHDGSKIEPGPIFTPTTKAESGHDEHLDAQVVDKMYGWQLREYAVRCYNRLADFALQRGLVLADTKFEFGKGGVLADEVGTPDSSRWWDQDEWVDSAQQKKSPAPYDKELVRRWGMQEATPDGCGLQHLDPEKKAHQAFVAQLTVPTDVIQETGKRYEIALHRLTGHLLPRFQKNKLGV